MANVNLRNYGTILGRVSKLNSYENRNGSHTYLLTVAAQNDYKNKDGTTGAQFIPLKSYIPETAPSQGIFPHLAIGDLVQVSYEVRNDNYTDKNGVKHYGIVLVITHIEFEETKAAKQARRARTDAEKERLMPTPVNYGELAADDDYDSYYDDDEELPPQNDPEVPDGFQA